jgi:hypothetical protein
MARLVTRSAIDLQESLTIDEATYRLISPHLHPDLGADYFHYAALDLVAKASASMWSRDDFLELGDDYRPDRALERLLLEMPRDEQEGWRRKLLEAWVDVVCGQAAGQPEFFSHLALIRELIDIASAQRDLQTYYGSRSRNYDIQMAHTRKHLAAVEADLDLTHAWYLGRSRPVAELAEREVPRALASFDRRLRAALRLATPRERMIVGYSYAPSFGAASRSVHFAGRTPMPRLTPGDVAQNAAEVLILALDVLWRIQNATERVPPGPNEIARGYIEQNRYPDELAEYRAASRAGLGDIVVAYGSYVGQVTHVATGLLGYESYRVKFIGDPPLPETPDDWFIPGHIHLAMSVDDFLSAVDARVTTGALSRQAADKMSRLPRAEVAGLLAESVEAMWRAAGFEPFRQMAAARETQRAPPTA